MTFTASFLLTADGKQAKAELLATGKAADKATKSVGKMGGAGKSAAAKNKALASSASRAEREIRDLAAAERIAAQSALKMGKSNKMAAGNLANLTAQFNDIGVMMAAGQNPLQLAMQQGTQITQIIGPMGAGGAVKALGSAFMQMINPVSLITLGSIAAGAAMVGWLTDAGEEALTFEEQLENLSDGIDNYAAAVKDAGLDTAAMIERFGSGAVEAKKYLEALVEVKRREAVIGATQVQKQFSTDAGDFFQEHNRFYVGNQFGLTGADGKGKGSHPLVAELIGAYGQLDSTANKSMDAQISAWQGLFDVVQRASQAADGVSEAENKQLKLIAEQVLRLQELVALDEAKTRVKDAAIAKQQEMLAGLKQEAAINQAIATYGASSAQVANLRLQYKRAAYQQDVAELGVAKALQDTLMKTFDQANPHRNPLAEWLISARKYAAVRLQSNLTDMASAQNMLQTLSEENALRTAILRHGEDSVQVTDLRQAAERRVLEQTIKTWNVSEDLKDELRAALNAGQDLANLDLASGISAASSEAEKLADWLGIALSKAMSLSQITPDMADEDVVMRQQVIPDGAMRARQRKSLENLIKITSSRKRPNGGSGGAAIRKERDAVEDLIKSLQDELQILRETSPVMSEMLGHRAALKDATDAEKDAVRGLIKERLHEQEVLGQRGLFNETMFDALDGLILRGESFADVMGTVGDMIGRAVLQAVLLGEGPLAGLFGSGNGLLNIVSTALIPGKSAGGLVHGPGSPSSDDVLMFGSSGEFMMNGKATARYRHLLEAMNSGMEIPGFSAGGMVLPQTGEMPTFSRPKVGAETANNNHDAGVVNHFHISSPDARSFSENRVAVARGAQRILQQAGRYN